MRRFFHWWFGYYSFNFTFLIIPHQRLCPAALSIIFITKHLLSFFSVWVLSVVWSLFFFIPATTANDLRLRRVSIPDLIHYIILFPWLYFKLYLFYNDYETSCSLASMFAFGWSSVWEETGVPGGNPPVWLGDHMTISHAAVRGECVNTAPARQLCKTPNWKDCKQILANISTVPVYLVNFCLLYILKQTEVSCWYPPYSYRPLHRQSVVVYGLQVVPVTAQILYPYSTPPSIECNKA